ncbi:ArnT family glycosyltransferase [Methylomagnum sp.]
MWHRALIRDYVLLWGILVIVGLACRPLTPVDETRAVSVAWEMWQRGDWLVPHLNGETYSHKPPLLQWGIHLGWLLAGVNDWTPRLVAPLFGLANLFLTAALARRLWPEQGEAHRLAPLILLSLPVWALWTSLTLYDMLVAFFTLLGMLGIWLSGQGETWRGRLLTGLAIGGGVLSKGPVILLLILPTGLLAPWWLAERPAMGWGRWYLGLFGSVLLGAVLALAWAIPAGIVGGEEYRRAIFWGQSAGRIANSFAHRRPWWWYGAILPILLFPWIFRVSLWRSRPWPQFKTDVGLRFCLAHAGAVTLLLSFVSGKQVHYILPVVPAVVLMVARRLPEASERGTRLDRWWLAGCFVALGAALIVVPMVHAGKGETAHIIAAAPLAAKLALIAIGLVLAFTRQTMAVRGTAYALIGLVLVAHPIYQAGKGPVDDMRPMATRLGQLQEQGVPVAHWGKYSGEFQFLGRLPQPLEVVMDQKELMDWLTAHPDGHLVIIHRSDRLLATDGAEFSQDYRGHRRRVDLWRAAALKADPTLSERLIGKEKQPEDLEAERPD